MKSLVMTKGNVLSAVGAFIIVTSFVPRPADAQRISASVSDSTAKFVSRMPLSAGPSIVTRSGDVALVLTDSTVVVQLTDPALQQITTDTTTNKKDEGTLARLAGAMIRAGVSGMLDRGLAYPLDMLEKARAEEGRIYLIDRNGKYVFESMTVNDGKPMHDFAPAEAASFAKRVNKAIKARQR